MINPCRANVDTVMIWRMIFWDCNRFRWIIYFIACRRMYLDDFAYNVGQWYLYWTTRSCMRQGCSICRYILLAVKLSICVHLRWRSWRIRFVASSQWSQKVLSRQTRAHWAAILKHSIMCFTKTRIYIKHDGISFYQNHIQIIVRIKNWI